MSYANSELEKLLASQTASENREKGAEIITIFLELTAFKAKNVEWIKARKIV